LPLKEKLSGDYLIVALRFSTLSTNSNKAHLKNKERKENLQLTIMVSLCVGEQNVPLTLAAQF
jgi:hypothetical protein